jgi:hypothetical protein
LEGKDGWVQADAEKCIIKIQADNFASSGIRPKSVYRFGTTGYKVTVAELTAQRF